MDTFSFTPTYTTEATGDQNATVVGYGDGYEQRAAAGLNSDRLSLRVVFENVKTAKAAAIVAFLRAHGTTQAFLWTAPAPYGDGGPLQWIRRGAYTHTWNSYDCETVQFTVDRDYNPL